MLHVRGGHWVAGAECDFALGCVLWLVSAHAFTLSRLPQVPLRSGRRTRLALTQACSAAVVPFSGDGHTAFTIELEQPFCVKRVALRFEIADRALRDARPRRKLTLGKPGRQPRLLQCQP